MNTDITYIFDFDKTIVSVEGLDLLAEINLADNPQKEQLLSKIKTITEQGMDGSLSFGESLTKRFALLHVRKEDIDRTVRQLKRLITPSILRNKSFFKKNAKAIYIISGGFKEYIVPITRILGIADSHVFGNTMRKNKKGTIIGFDKRNPLSHENGKVEIVKRLRRKNIIAIGDGFTDSQIKAMGAAKRFVAFTEHVLRENITQNADEVVKSFDEFLFNNKLPMTISYPKSKIKVVLLENIHPNAVELFKKEGFQVEAHEKSYSGDELDDAVGDAMILGIRSRTKLTESFFKRHPRLRVVGAYCIGTNQIDILSGSNQGVAIFNAPFSNTRSVVELALGEMIMLMRGTFQKSNEMKNGIWNKSAEGSHELRGKRLGIVGYGHIGTQLSVIAENLGMRVLFYDIHDVLPMGNARRCHTLKELLSQADFVTIHVDGREENRNLIGKKEFESMREGSIFLNLSRGFVVDIDALSNALTSGHISGAGIDVFPHEPSSKGERFISPLIHAENVILTPHIAGSTQEAQADIGTYVAKKTINYINMGITEMSVNMPVIAAPPAKGAHRLLHIHKNVPGMLAQINGILAEHNINIEQQTLKTNDQIGYLITDINKKYDHSILNLLKKIPDTIRFRIVFA